MEQVVILMTTYQGEAYLKEQMDSILAQDYPHWRLIVRDDGSQDATMLLLSAYANAHPDKISVERNAVNKGAAKNFLTLLADAAGEYGGSDTGRVYFMFADQDDIWHADKLRRTLRRMKRVEKRYGASQPALVFTDAAVVDEIMTKTADSFIRHQHLNAKKLSLNHLLMENVCQGCTMMMNAPLARLVKVPDEGARYHDWWVALIAAAHGHISYLPEATLDYRQHGGNAVGAHEHAAYVRERVSHKEQREKALADTFAQGKCFWELYRDTITDSAKREAAAAFAKMGRQRPLQCCVNLLKNRFFKSGFVRNLGVLWTLRGIEKTE